MGEKYTFDDTILIGKKEIQVSEIVGNKKKMFELIKKGYDFEDEVLAKAGIKRVIGETHVHSVCVEHEKDKKVYAKETESIKNILKSLNTIENFTQQIDEEIEEEQETIENVE